MIEAFTAFLFGLLIGSFLNVCISRWPQDLSVVRPRSHCPACQAPIDWYDLVPLASYITLGGRCRHCHARIPWRYPVVELLTGVLFFLLVYRFGPTLFAGKLCVFAAILIALLFTDLEERLLPDELTLGGTAIGLLLAIVAPTPDVISGFFPQSWLSRLIMAGVAAGLPAGVLWSAGWIYSKARHREGVGLGDVKMVALLGCFLGLENGLFTLILGSIAGAVLGLAYIKLTGKDAATYELPFGTFLSAAGLVAIVFGKQMFHW